MDEEDDSIESIVSKVFGNEDDEEMEFEDEEEMDFE